MSAFVRLCCDLCLFVARSLTSTRQLVMKLGSAGEAFFVEENEGNERVSLDFVTSPIG